MTQADTDMMTTFGIKRTRVPNRNRCEYCKGSGFELVWKKVPEVYGEDGPPVEYAVPCRECKGKRSSYREETRSRLNLPYDAYLAAFNPSIYVDKDGKRIDFSKQFKFIVGYIEKFPKIMSESYIKGLYIHSETGGSGKTFLASIICNEIYSKYQLMPVYVTENNLLNELERVVTANQEKPREVYKKAQVLFIDDMWRKYSGRDWLLDEMFGIIDYRYSHNLCTIVTSNVSLESNRIDKRIAGRLNEMCASFRMPECEVRAFNKSENKKTLMDIINGD